MAINNTSIEDLLSEIFEILQKQNEDNPANLSSESVEGTKQNFGSVKFIQNSKTIPKEEIEFLTTLALARESALGYLRKNNLSPGEKILEEISSLIQEEDLTEEGSLISSTYDDAANSFLALKKGEHQQAIDLMEQAMLSHQKLFENYNHPIEVRRIHLARNIAKILSTSQKYEEAFLLSVQLTIYVAENTPTAWPMKIVQLKKPDQIPLQSKMFVLNQITKEIDYLLSKHATPKIMDHFNQLIDYLVDQSNPQFQLLKFWCLAYRSKIQKEELSFLQNSLAFSKAYNGLLPYAQNFLLSTIKTHFLS